MHASAAYRFTGKGVLWCSVPKWLSFPLTMWGVVFTACVVFLFLYIMGKLLFSSASGIPGAAISENKFKITVPPVTEPSLQYLRPSLALPTIQKRYYFFHYSTYALHLLFRQYRSDTTFCTYGTFLYPLLSLRSSTSTVHDKGWPEPFFFTVHIRYFFVSLACHVLLLKYIARKLLCACGSHKERARQWSLLSEWIKGKRERAYFTLVHIAFSKAWKRKSKKWSNNVLYHLALP